MDFMPQPDEAKKFGTKWIKWHIMKYPHLFMIGITIPFLVYKIGEVTFRLNKDIYTGKYVPNVIMNRYAICRPDDFLAKSTPTRYRN